MTIEHDSSGTPTVGAKHAIARGFLIRLLYGSFGLFLVVLVRPDFLGENLHLLAGGTAIYLLVCLAGGAVDAATGRPKRMELLPKPRAADVLWLVLLVVVLFILWQGR